MTSYPGHGELRRFPHALHFDVRLLRCLLSVILSSVRAMRRWRSLAWTKRNLDSFLTLALLLALHAGGGRRPAQSQYLWGPSTLGGRLAKATSKRCAIRGPF